MKTPTLARVIRLDSMPINQAYFTEEGYLKDEPILTSTGIFEYRNPDGSVRRELRLPEEVFDKESLESYKGKPIIITHDAGLIDKNNVGEEQIGTILSEGIKSGSDVKADIIIHDTTKMKRTGLKELSLGYNLDLEETPGVWRGQKYDAIQRNIRINHLALVREARAGEQARLNIDSRDSQTILKGGKISMAKNKKTRRNDGILSPEELQKAIEEYKSHRKNRNNGDDETELKNLEKETEVEVDSEEEMDVSKFKKPEDKVKAIQNRRNKRDEQGDPENKSQAMENIANQDEDIDTLIDIIDTLLAERDFNGSNKDSKDEELEEFEDFEEDEDEDFEEEEDEFEADEDEEFPEEDDEFEEDEDDEEFEDEFEEDEEDDEENEDVDILPTSGTLNTDSVDKIVRERVRVGMIGRNLNLDGLENLPLRAAKKKVIKKVKGGIRLDGKSDTYIDAMFDMVAKEVSGKSKKGAKHQKKSIFNSDSKSDTSARSYSSDDARERMIARQQNRNKEEF